MFGFGKKKDTNVIQYSNEQKRADGYLSTMLNAVTRTLRQFGSGGLYGFSPDGKRNFNQLFGYGEQLYYQDYYEMYKRGGIAGVIVGKVAKTCWRDMPTLFDDNDNGILDDELAVLKRMGFFRAMERADILNRIGNFSVLLIGLPDGQDLNQPIGQARKGGFDGIYFNAYGYNGIEITKYDTDPASPRYGLPILYQLQVIDTDGSKRKQTQFKSLTVHYSRVVHMAEGALESDIEGMSSLEQSWNALTDKDKVRGSSAEAYFRNARQKLALEVEKGSQPDQSAEGKAALKENVENFQNNWEDVLRLNNMNAKMLNPQMASPRDPFDVAVEEVAGTTGIPVRILTTKAGGTVTGSEDKATWNALIGDRQDSDCTVWLLDALSIFDEAGIIELPEVVNVVWPVQAALGEREAAEASKDKADAFKSTIEGLSMAGGDEVVAKSVFKQVGLDGIETDDIDFSDENLDGAE